MCILAGFNTNSNLPALMVPHIPRPCVSVARIPIAELYAIIFAFKSILRFSFSFVIFSRLLSALILLQSRPDSNSLVTQIQEWLFRLSVRRSCVTCWVPRHAGITRNETVDSLARSPPSLPNIIFPIHPCIRLLPHSSAFFSKQW